MDSTPLPASARVHWNHDHIVQNHNQTSQVPGYADFPWRAERRETLGTLCYVQGIGDSRNVYAKVCNYKIECHIKIKTFLEHLGSQCFKLQMHLGRCLDK